MLAMCFSIMTTGVAVSHAFWKEKATEWLTKCWRTFGTSVD